MVMLYYLRYSMPQDAVWRRIRGVPLYPVWFYKQDRCLSIHPKKRKHILPVIPSKEETI